jgi:hypothetical protein
MRRLDDLTDEIKERPGRNLDYWESEENSRSE